MLRKALGGNAIIPKAITERYPESERKTRSTRNYRFRGSQAHSRLHYARSLVPKCDPRLSHLDVRSITRAITINK